jgi:YgiT-type zinc finger domain-containing protein
MHQLFEDCCVTCGHSPLARERVRSAFWEGARLVVVEGIPAFSCGGCGERFYDDATSAALQRMRQEGFPAGKARCEVVVPVFTFDGA